MCIRDSTIDIAVRGAHRAQRSKFIEMVLGTGIERLGDNHQADNDPEDRACEKRRTRPGPDKPARAAALLKLRGSPHLGARQARLAIVAHLLELRARPPLDDQVAY